MPPFMVGILILLIIFAWFVMGGDKSTGEKIMILVIYLCIYLAYRLLNGATLTEALVEPFLAFFKRSP